MDDVKLIRRVLRSNDRNAANELVGRYYDEIYRYAFRQSIGNNTDTKQAAEDLTQDIFVSALRSLSTFNPRKAGFRTWLYTVANSRLIDSKRKFRPNEVQIDETEIVYEQDFTDEIESQELLRKIVCYIESKPSEIQKIFRLHLWNDFTFAQIAEVMELPEATVKTKYYRILKEIKEVFKDEY
ncbi:MAG: RNA polymerase sigma factor [Ruminococcus sp.]|jgi:RNA polymerase sigma-70 factor (ECF subfamily)|nr:RNA polymerase sigma factor [Ruminococcus sp.]